MQAIVAVDKNWGIGYKNELLFHVPEDMKFFKEKTLGKVVVMGKNTFLSLPGQNPLPNRVNIVLSRSKNFNPDGIVLINSLEDLLEKLQEFESEDIFIVGGQSVYKMMLPYCHKIYVTHFDEEVTADTFFPNLGEMPEWKKTFTSEKILSKGHTFSFNTYERAF
ncbi:MAG TPA: dihydrofolate reductase [Clostridiales bacterium]|jgi:dihydrofolate reductase|nr:dihydrofolate reductase [Clostridiales bacterium]HRT82784.1 dihydrofolate reductase [Oscillospiraceae bacterium]